MKALTDNKNRTASNIRHLFSKNGGNLAETGSVTSFAFEFVGVAYVGIGKHPSETVEEWIIDSGARDYSLSDDSEFRVVTEKVDLIGAVRALKDRGLEVSDFGLEYVPTALLEVTDFDKALKIIKLVGDLEEDDDVEVVWSNYDISDELLSRVEQAIEDVPFHT